MNEDDLLPRVTKPAPKNLEPLSVGELNAYIAELEAEIARVRADIAAKQAHRLGADTLFKRPR